MRPFRARIVSKKRSYRGESARVLKFYGYMLRMLNAVFNVQYREGRDIYAITVFCAPQLTHNRMDRENTVMGKVQGCGSHRRIINFGIV